MTKKLDHILKAARDRIGGTERPTNLGGYTPKAGDEAKFAAKHTVADQGYPEGTEAQFKGSFRKYVMDDPKNARMGNKESEAKAAYESVDVGDMTIDEATEVLDEISKEKLQKYKKGASAQKRYSKAAGNLMHDYRKDHEDTPGVEGDKVRAHYDAETSRHHNLVKKRDAGIKLAIKKLKEDVEVTEDKVDTVDRKIKKKDGAETVVKKKEGLYGEETEIKEHHNIDQSLKGPGKHVGYGGGETWHIHKTGKKSGYHAVGQRSGRVHSGETLGHISQKLESEKIHEDAHPVEFYDARERKSKAKWHYDQTGKNKHASLSKGIKQDYEAELLSRGVKDSDGKQKSLIRHEETEGFTTAITEISKYMAGRYINHANIDHGSQRAKSANAFSSLIDGHDKDTARKALHKADKKADKRRDGIGLAVSKLTGRAKVNAKEETEVK